MTTLSRFEIHQPATALEASQMLAHYGEDGGIYAGGTELLLAMKHSALNYRHLIDLKTIPGLSAIEMREDALEIGSTSTHRNIERSVVVLQRQPVLCEMESHVANVRVFRGAAFRSGDIAPGPGRLGADRERGWRA
jgi:carbon-monoxide dehydrogenase medium subunit